MRGRMDGRSGPGAGQDAAQGEALRVRIVDANAAEAMLPGLRRGEAGHVWVDDAGDLQTDTRVALSPNTAHALLGHGVVDELNRLGLQGRLGAGRDVLVPPTLLDATADLLYEADRKTYGARYEFPVARDASVRPPVEIRLRIDNREYQRSLARLTFLIRTASREGRAVRLRL